MAAAPVIIDDGGSTRIKQMSSNDNGRMDDLLDVGPLPAGSPAPNGAQGSEHIVNGGAPLTQIKVVFQDATGTPFTIPNRVFNNFLISSGSQSVRGDKMGNALKLTIFSVVEAPDVEAKQRRGKRRYVVNNAPPIDQVAAPPPAAPSAWAGWAGSPRRRRTGCSPP